MQTKEKLHPNHHKKFKNRATGEFGFMAHFVIFHLVSLGCFHGPYDILEGSK